MGIFIVGLLISGILIGIWSAIEFGYLQIHLTANNAWDLLIAVLLFSVILILIKSIKSI